MGNLWPIQPPLDYLHRLSVESYVQFVWYPLMITSFTRDVITFEYLTMSWKFILMTQFITGKLCYNHKLIQSEFRAIFLDLHLICIVINYCNWLINQAKPLYQQAKKLWKVLKYDYHLRILHHQMLLLDLYTCYSVIHVYLLFIEQFICWDKLPDWI